MPIYRHINAGAVFADGLGDLADLRRRYIIGGAPTISVSPFGNALTLDGAADYLKRTEANWRSSDSLGSITGWLRLSATGGQVTVFSSADEGSILHFLRVVVWSTDRIAIQTKEFGVADTVTGTTVLVLSRWYHFAIVSNGSSYTLYLDGQSETPIIESGVNIGNWFADITLRNNITIGALERTLVIHYFPGQIRDVSVWPRVLTAEEVLDLATNRAFDY